MSALWQDEQLRRVLLESRQLHASFSSGHSSTTASMSSPISGTSHEDFASDEDYVDDEDDDEDMRKAKEESLRLLKGPAMMEVCCCAC